ncbi:hypothetical protein [Acinetobacter lanii]|uniref:hypothetical protein n=1 Tax=Acinetobacter lanii TaxID=2715163 RepID=UPI001D0ED357|nr:hypothetical protein [Acinetobacter lanii]
MSNLKGYFSFLLVFVISIFTSACQQQYVVGPTQPTEAALVANAIGNGLSTELDIPYETAFENLKTAYRICVAFTREDELVFTDNELNTQLKMGTLFGRSEGKVYVYKTTLEKLRNNKTRMTLYLPEGYPFAKTRFKQDVKRALGQDKYCKA